MASPEPATKPFRQFVVKVASRCDLACDHCYVYEHADQGWKLRPHLISDETLVRTAGRIADHVRAHAVANVAVILHGGEPLLAGHDRLARAISRFRTTLDDLCRLDLRIHTNGVLLDDRLCALFSSTGTKVGISLDGDRAANDRHRRHPDGRSSHHTVLRAVDLLRTRYPEAYAGLLCTIDLENDPVAVYRALMALNPPAIDFLLPHATWDRPPPRAFGTAYADWLIPVFDLWVTDPRPTGVRTFETILRTGRGESSLTESLGLDGGDLVVIETDGAYEQPDSLKTAYDKASETGLDVFRHTLDDVARHASMAGHRGGAAALCDTCRGCPVVSNCGGGLYAHRYQTGSGFLNPSVYCKDLLKLICHVIPPKRVGEPDAPAAGSRGTEVTASRHKVKLDALAAGHGDAEAIRQLAAGQISLQRVLISRIGVLAGTGHSRAWNLLSHVDAAHPDVVRRLLSAPYLRLRATECLSSKPEGLSTQAASVAAAGAALAVVAAAAAILARVPASITVPVTEGTLHLPTLGRLDLPEEREAVVETVPDGFTVTASGRTTRIPLNGPAPEGWSAPRRLSVGTAPSERLSIVLDDLDPYRDRYHLPASPHLTEAEVARWQAVLGDAWDLIRRDLPAYAPAIRAGLSVITPLRGLTPGREASATARNAPGAIALALPEGHVTLALLLVHEFQHVKLGAILDMFDLYDTKDDRLYQVPWRDDPRPVEALLQGAYAHLAVADFWRIRHSLHGDKEAERRFRQWHADVSAAVEVLIDSGALTERGNGFVQKMRATLRGWTDHVAPDDT